MGASGTFIRKRRVEECIAKPNEKAQQVRFKNKSKQVKNIYLRQLEVTIK